VRGDLRGVPKRYPLKRQADTRVFSRLYGGSLENGSVFAFCPPHRGLSVQPTEGTRSATHTLARQHRLVCRRVGCAPLERRSVKAETHPRKQGRSALGRLIAFLFVTTSVMGVVNGDDAAYQRLAMVDNSDETGMRDCIKQAAAAASVEDLDAYISCFTEGQQKPMRRKAAMLFVRHTVTLELLDCHLIEETDTHSTLAIKYKVDLTGEKYDVVSLLHMQKERNAWRISRERVETSKKSKPVYDTQLAGRVGCAGGQCRLVPQ